MHAGRAQEVERILGKDEVTSSNLVISSIRKRYSTRSASFLHRNRADRHGSNRLCENLSVSANLKQKCSGGAFLSRRADEPKVAPHAATNEMNI